jgi:hypothetical protein
MSTSLKSPDGLKDAECEKGQLSHQPPIPYVPVVDIVTPKEEPQVFKIKLPDASHLNMPIYSRGNNEEYLALIVAVLRVIKQKRLPKKCRVLAKAVVRQSEALKNLEEATELQDTVSMTVDVTARKERLSRPNRCSKKPRRLMTRQLLSCMSNWGTCCPATHSPNGIVSAVRCMSMTRGLQ